MARPRLSLRAQALAWLAQREHSERELRRKLQRYLAAEAASAGQADTDHGEADDEPSAAAIDAVIQGLLAQGHLSPERFVESRIHQRALRQGLVRIRQDLAQHGLSLPAEKLHELQSTELARASALWERRFGRVAADDRGRARQARFLTARGFSGDVVRRVLREAQVSAPAETPPADGPEADG